MNRRGFLGTFGGIVASGIIVKATDADIRAFAASPLEPLEVFQPEPDSYDGLYLYNSKGVRVAIINDIRIQQPERMPIDFFTNQEVPDSILIGTLRRDVTLTAMILPSAYQSLLNDFARKV